MFELDLEHISEDGQTVLVQEEPDLELALPQVFEQPELKTLKRQRLAHVEGLVAQVYRDYLANPKAGLGPNYQELVTEFQPLFAWAIACWDYLLSTEGCRFILRSGDQKNGVLRLPAGRHPEERRGSISFPTIPSERPSTPLRTLVPSLPRDERSAPRDRMSGARRDYRAVTDKDYSRLIHAIFRKCLLEFAQQSHVPSLSHWLRERFWPLVLEAYRRLEQPADLRQRTLTPYSYLRCVPYEFLNDFHHDLVYSTVWQLPDRERQAIDVYFLHFFTEDACAEALHCPLQECVGLLRQALIKLLLNHRLVYCLLRQIERY